MFDKVQDADFIRGEHDVLKFWQEQRIFDQLRRKNAGKPAWSFLDGPITANNPMGVHHAWGRTYKDTFQRYWAMNGRELRYQNGFDCQGLWVEVEVEKQLGLGAKSEIERFGVDRFVRECKKRVLRYAAIQTEQSIRLGYWMDWDDPNTLRRLADALGSETTLTITTPRGVTVTDTAERIVEQLGKLEWGGSYFTFSTENNETIWRFLKKCHQRGKIYRGYDVMPWSGRGGSAYSQMEVADGRKLTVHRALFVRFPLLSKDPSTDIVPREPVSSSMEAFRSPLNEYLLVWTTTPWTLTSNVAALVNPDLKYVKLRTVRDGAVYYLAEDNLEYPRLSQEFKEGFGRPEWSWPKDCPKLKTLAQIFKEQGGFEIEGTVWGREMLGWRYRGPFDDLPAQFTPGGYPARLTQAGGQVSQELTGVACHRVVDGGRDSRGQPVVLAGEGTGIVHCAPGCGDIDYQIGLQQGLVRIAPLAEDGRFLPGFGAFSGRLATAAETVDLIIDDLRRKGLLIAIEKYPHIYPFCWRTGDELVFRLVDEWFIRMDWREEIMNVTRQIRWLPESINGMERELEWLTNMRDWMISKKRYWGLALPIWVDEQTGEFEVIGSLEELRARAVQGWEEFAGHSPHKPWIDQVKIRNPRTGNLMSRIPDVGNPWLDAGIVAFSTLGYNTARDYWHKWYPADFVTECFPGQFRNWFYSLLAMATMMEGSPPFKTLLGHRLVMDEQGRPMHKSDGTAIWFEEAAEQLGVDTLRWMYLQQNPAQDLRFGTRHPDQKVTLQTPQGPRQMTIDGAETCLVTSGPADDVRRLVLLPLWNSYGFFINYARRVGFDPCQPGPAVEERPEIDRWILSNLQALIQRVRTSFEAYDTPAVCQAVASFIDDLSNWYIRRNRRRFRGTGELLEDADSAPEDSELTADGGNLPPDRAAAFHTLYEVLLTLTKLAAPLIPFITERMYRNLSQPWREHPDYAAQTPPSVHLCDYPIADERWLDSELNERMELAQRVVRLGHKLRDSANVRVRQPLPELRVACSQPAQRAALASLTDLIAEELNVKQVTLWDSLGEIVRYGYKPNLKTLGPKYGRLLAPLRVLIPQLDSAQGEALRSGQAIILEVEGTPLDIQPQDVLITVEQAADWYVADDWGLQVALSTRLNDALRQEGMARDFIRHVQQWRKELKLDIDQVVKLYFSTPDEQAAEALLQWQDVICRETTSRSLERVPSLPPEARSAQIGNATVQIELQPVNV
ncbi:MAG: hypothetical protein KatS3mg114_1102 [Planctomycetaceae bacterium]|nr:MAG: hypothetical protein KatS3mg114_1102 [Planctomycetaceae bacterium]